jgi:hypothetical protein
MRKKLVIGGLAVLAALAIACGSGNGKTGASTGDNPSPAGTGPVTAKIGEKVSLTSTFLDDTDTVEITVANPKQYTKEPGEFGSRSEKGIFLVLTVTITCTEGTYSANPFNFKFVAADGTAYEGAIAVFKPALDAVDLSKGQKTSGTIVFDVPKAAVKGGKVQVDGIGTDYNEPAAYWAL